MGHLAQLVADAHRRPQRDPQPFDRFTKAELWERLRAAEKALASVASITQDVATFAHNCAQGASGEPRRQLFAARDYAYKARDAAQSGFNQKGDV